MIKSSVNLSRKETIWGFAYYGVQMTLLPFALVFVNLFLPKPFPEAAINFTFFFVNFLAVTLIFRDFLLKNLHIALARPWFTLRYAGIGLGIYFLGNALFSLLITWVAPNFANINDLSILQMAQSHYALMSIGTVFLVPVVEECFYRGLLFRKLYDRHPVLAYGISMVIFSLSHIAGYIGLTDFGTLCLCFLQYLPAGFALAWSYRRSGSILSPILLHMTVNQLGMLAMR